MKESKTKRARAGGAGKAVFLGAMLTGSVSRSNDTAKIHRLFRDGHALEADFKSAVQKDAEEILNAQKSFAFTSSGQLDWLDALRPLTSCFEGFAVRSSSGEDAVGPVTRWFRTDTFYRKPLVNSRIDCRGGELAKIMPNASSASVIFLPAPYTFSRLVENSFYDSDKDLAMDYARAVAKSTKELHERGYRCILLSDPLVGYEQSRGRHKLPDWFSTSLSEIKSPGTKVGINFPLAEIDGVIPHVEQSTVDFIGIDVTFSSDFNVNTSKDVLVGVVDGARPLVESAGEIEKRVRSLVSKANFSGKYYIGPSDRLWDVPFESGLKKIAALAAFKGV